jgi:hypothetical protein
MASVNGGPEVDVTVGSEEKELNETSDSGRRNDQ